MMASVIFKRWSKTSAGDEVWFGRDVEQLPNHKLSTLEPNIFASYTGPDSGLLLCYDLEQKLQQCVDPDGCNNSIDKTESSVPGLIAGARNWKLKNRKAYGISMSLYDQNPVSGKISGDPIADSFGLCARGNSAIMVVADGVNWGEKSRLAARCAVYGTMKYVNEQLFGSCNTTVKSTQDVFNLLLSSLDAAQATILQHEGGLTTLCVAFICPLKSSRHRAVCVVSVGDSLAFVLSRRHGMREVTTGSRDVTTARDIRDAGGALGPVRNGTDPELHNLTLSITLVDPGDIVFLTTDGISDNFDPVVTKIAVASVVPKLADCNGTKSPVRDEIKQVCEEATDQNNRLSSVSMSDSTPDKSPTGSDHRSDLNGAHPETFSPAESESKHIEDSSSPVADNGQSKDGRPIMTPCERHCYAVKEMERIVNEFELFTESACSAQELTGALVQHVLKLTDTKRKVLENPELYRRRRKLDQAERERRDAEIVARLAKSPGKLDHATVIAYEVGEYHGDEDEDYCVSGEDDVDAGQGRNDDEDAGGDGVCVPTEDDAALDADESLSFNSSHFAVEEDFD